LRVVRYEPRYAEAWAALFEASASACFCRYWHFAGTKNEWLERCAREAQRNRAEQQAELDLMKGDGASGLLALDGDSAVGWMKLEPRESLRKLTGLPVYRSAPAPPAGERVFCVGCLLVAPSSRRRGVASALVAAADEHALERGGTLLEAYPRRSPGPLHDEEAWMGPESIFVRAGYSEAAGAAPYPIYRKSLRPPPLP